MFDYDYYVIGPLMIVGPWLLGGWLGWRWGVTWRGLAAAIGLGVVATGASLATFVLTAPSSEEEACGEDECVRFLGEWLEITLVRDFPIYTAGVVDAAAALMAGLHRSNLRASAHHPE